jgi:Cd2+/Zn2+-exporting ATPase
MVLGEWVEASTVVFLFALSQWLEARSMERARRAIGTLVDQAPAEVTLRTNGTDARVPAERVAVGDLLIVRAGERVALDGEVVAGDSDVNQAPVTGEWCP